MTNAQRWAVSVAVIVFVVATVYVLFVTVEQVRRTSPDLPLDLEGFGYTQELVNNALRSPEARQEQQRFLLIDALIYIPVYMVCALVILWNTLDRAVRPWRLLACALVLVLVAVDYFEDAMNWITVAAFPATDPGLIGLASRTTTAKWLISGFTIFIGVGAFLSRLPDLNPIRRSEDRSLAPN